MLLAPLRKRRDELAARVLEETRIPKQIVEECCQGKTDEYIEDDDGIIAYGLNGFRTPHFWHDFINACDAVKREEYAEYTACRR